jgi:hypothetical protein
MAVSKVTLVELGQRAGAKAGLVVVNFTFAGDVADRHLWICPPGMRYRLHYAGEIHTVAEGTSTTYALALVRTQETGAPSLGDDVLASFFDLKAAANTLQTLGPKASHVALTTDFFPGDRLSADFGYSDSAPDSLVGAVLTAVLMPISDVRHRIF